jgi:Flp pilus assembly protein TadG
MSLGIQIESKRAERGAMLVLVAVTLVVLLAVAALAIDLGMLYVARNEAQRAADAAALAGAEVFITSGCTSTGGCTAGGPQETLARQQAEAVAAHNYIIGQSVIVEDTDITFSYPNAEEPQITVAVARTEARKDAVNTLFAKMFGVFNADVSVTATAEAYSPAGAASPPATVAENCVAPFLVPNCDPNHLNVPSGNVNPVCDNNAADAGYFITPDTTQLENPELSPTGAIGEEWQLHTNAAPSQWYLVAFGGSQSGSNERTWIAQCTPMVIACGSTIQTMNGAKVGPTTQGVDDRIHASNQGPGKGQDTMSLTAGSPPPFQITGGSNNPIPALIGQIYYGPSDSQVMVPVYDGHQLNPGGDTVTVVGFMQLFINWAKHSGNSDVVDSYILNVLPCNSGGGTASGSGTTPDVVDAGGSPIPIRLIHQ